MRVCALLFCAFWLTAPLTGCIFGRGDGKKSQTRKARETPEDEIAVEIEGGQQIQLPVSVENINIRITFDLSDNCRLLKMDSAGEKLLIISTVDGEFSKDSENHIAAQDTSGGLKLIFELGAERVIHLQHGQQVAAGDIMAETTDPLFFYVEENGQRLKQRLNILNEAERYVKVSETGKGCSKPPQ